ncbi:MAG: hypothetical protein IJO41_00815 [Oscillospiraceae bacterium]|nr:hypothetical protein [Oscillospiraceae bacterium]MBQ9836519.1 hypothetical protein [Oscillospiraceae bacterium]
MADREVNRCNRICSMNDPDKGCLLGGVASCRIGSEQVMRREEKEVAPAGERRLIDANALKYTRVRIFHGMLDNGEPLVGGFNAVVMSCAIKDAPTVDAVEVVRCKECLHSRELNKYEKQLYSADCVGCTRHSVSYHDAVMRGDDFCSYGERRDADNSRDLSGYADKLREIKEGL